MDLNLGYGCINGDGFIHAPSIPKWFLKIRSVDFALWWCMFFFLENSSSHPPFIHTCYMDVKKQWYDSYSKICVSCSIPNGPWHAMVPPGDDVDCFSLKQICCWYCSFFVEHTYLVGGLSMVNLWIIYG